MSKQGEPTSAHYKGVIGRLSEKIGRMSVELASLHQRIDEYQQETEEQHKIIQDQDARIARLEHDAEYGKKVVET